MGGGDEEVGVGEAGGVESEWIRARETPNFSDLTPPNSTKINFKYTCNFIFKLYRTIVLINYVHHIETENF